MRCDRSPTYNRRKGPLLSIDLKSFCGGTKNDVSTPFTGVMQIKEIDHNLPSGAFVQVQTKSPMIVLPEYTDCGFFAKNKAATNYECSVEFEILLVDN